MITWRFYTTFAILVIVGAALASRLFFLQVIEADLYSALSQGQHIGSEESAPRGSILLQDRASDSLFEAAITEERYLVFASPDNITDAEVGAIATHLAPLLNREEEGLMTAILGGSGSYLVLAQDLSRKEAEQIDEALIPNIYTRAYKTRAYPGNTLASHVLGFLGFREDGRVGQYGVEEYYEEELRRDDLELTIDYTIQFMVEKKLQEIFLRLGAEEGSVIIMNPKTGEILALASVPVFDPNIYNEVEDIGVFLNSAIQKVFEPGSVFKPIVMAAAINEGVVGPQTTYVDTGRLTLSGYTIRNSDLKSYGTQTMTEVLEKSLNTGAVFVEEHLGKKKFREYLQKFRIGRATGVDLAGEARGDITNILETNRDINFATASYGQGIATTPLGLLTAFSALANDGVMMRPHVQKEEPQKLGQPITKDTAQLITNMLVSVVNNGYGAKAAVPGYRVAGKTGTAQVPAKDGKGYSEDESIHSFIGYAPADDPAFIGLISLKNPKDINFSADSVAPVFGEIASFILQYYQVPPRSAE